MTRRTRHALTAAGTALAIVVGTAFAAAIVTAIALGPAHDAAIEEYDHE